MNRREKYLTYAASIAREGERLATCHPDRKHYALGMCLNCYDAYQHRKNYKGEVKERRKARNKNWYQQNRGLINEKWIAKKRGMTHKEYVAMRESQSNLCAICGRAPELGERLRLDHSHETGQVRELLCNTCNAGIGQFYDNPALLEKAITYLRKHERKNALRVSEQNFECSTKTVN